MAEEKPSGTLAELYENRIGTPTTDDEVNGYWLFAVGVLLALLGVVVFALSTNYAEGTDSYFLYRQIAVVLGGVGIPLIMIGAIVRFPLRAFATTLAYVGGVLCVLALAWFLLAYPSEWPLPEGRVDIVGLYTLGLLLVGLAGAVIPLITDPVRDEYAELQQESAGTAAELEETQTRVRELEEEVAAKDAELEALQSSNARFELFEDKSGKHRWRLRHRNGNVIADGGQGYSSRQKCQQGLHSVKRNALGAGVLRIEAEPEGEAETPVPEDADDPDVAIPAEPVESQASFELFEDDAGEWRWRLRHDNGNVIADSGEGYSKKSNAKRAMNRVREHAATADYLRIDPAGFELYRDRGGEYRWRLVHENGNVIADSGESYSSRSKARQGVESVKSNVGDAEVEEQ